MSKVRDVTQIIASIDGGDFAADLNREVSALLAEGFDRTNGRKKTKYKAKVTIVLDVEIEDGAVNFAPGLKVDTPKKPRSGQYYWTNSDGEILTQHPQQTQFAFGVRDAAEV